jgi:hypothetical protein
MAGLSRRKPRIATRLGAVALAVLLGSYAAAQTVYKWTDDDGVVHFADNPPPRGMQYEKRDVPPPPTAAEASAGEAGPAGAPAEKFEGPARVILISNDSFPSGDNSRHVIGVVKNVGGDSAANVRVTVRITDSQGNECDSEDISVAPSALDPGASGNFDTTIDSPCFADGGGNVDAAPKWE